jgi:four helix bundle protein
MRIELENRLIDFSVNINTLVLGLKKNLLAFNLSKQIIRSATSAALNFGEVQGAESRNDFIHKNSIVLKELRETEICLKIIIRSHSTNAVKEVENLIKECRQLIGIFQKTINTLKSKQK